MVTPARKAQPRTTLGADGFPLLETGYHLMQPEFHRRYEQMPEVKRAELIEGVVFIGSPVRLAHAKSNSQVSCWLEIYIAATPGLESGVGASVILDRNNEYQPDVFLRIVPERGGQTQVTEEKYILDAPELVVEVSLSSLSQDLHEKLAVYRRSGVREYIVWALRDSEIRWYSFESRAEVRLTPNRAGVTCSRFFPGLWLDTAALLAQDMSKVLTTVRLGIKSPEHAAFVKKLSAAR